MNRLRTTIAALGAALTMGSLVAAPALAWSDELQGRPDNLHAGGDLGYYIWHDDDGLHLRTTGPGPRHEFRAEIRTEGDINNVHLVRLEGNDSAAVRDGGHTLVVHFETWDGIDGVDFRIDGGEGMRLRLTRDDALSPTDEIFIGHDADHPNHNPFFEAR